MYIAPSLEGHTVQSTITTVTETGTKCVDTTALICFYLDARMNLFMKLDVNNLSETGLDATVVAGLRAMGHRWRQLGTLGEDTQGQFSVTVYCDRIVDDGDFDGDYYTAERTFTAQWALEGGFQVLRVCLDELDFDIALTLDDEIRANLDQQARALDSMRQLLTDHLGQTVANTVLNSMYDTRGRFTVGVGAQEFTGRLEGLSQAKHNEGLWLHLTDGVSVNAAQIGYVR